MIEDIKKNVLVFDIETWAEYSNGEQVNIMAAFDQYVELAVVKWIGLYSYKHDKYYDLIVSENRELIKQLFEEHYILVGFNNEEFDFPIMVNNGLINPDKKYLQVDCMSILGAASFRNKKGFSFKNRGALMDYKFKNNKLRTMAEEMKLEFQKGDIDYEIFQKTSWTPEETAEIKKYLKGDVLSTKGMFDKLWDYWKPFTELLDYKNIKNLSWIRSSIASLIYKSACHLLQVEETYSDKPPSATEEMGGRVIDPKYEEARDVWYIDFTSLYPHIMIMFNLFNETTETFGKNIFHGNDVFKVRGYYNVSHQHKLSVAVQEKLKERITLKKTDPKNPMVYTIKIFLNGLYGIVRSAIFEQVHTPNAGWDTCWIGQQIQKLTEDMMDKFGFETIAGDTDSLFVVAKDKKDSNKEYVKECLEKIVAKILHNVPFPAETYNIDIEDFLLYVMFPFSEQPVIDPETGKNLKKGSLLIKKRQPRKKNYMYLYEKNGKLDIKLVGLPIKKANATKLGLKIYNEVLKPKILAEKRAKFDKEFIDETISEFLKDKEIMSLLSREFKVKPFDTYKKESQIQAQISKGYFGGGSGVINLIKNFKVGQAGKGTKYCSVEEAIEANLSVEDLDLEKLDNELEPFILNKVLTTT